MTDIKYTLDGEDISVHIKWRAGALAVERLLLCAIVPFLSVGLAVIWIRLLLGWPSLGVLLCVIYFSLGLAFVAWGMALRPKVLGAALRVLVPKRDVSAAANIGVEFSGVVHVGALPRGIALAGAGVVWFFEWDRVAPFEASPRGYIITTLRPPIMLIAFVPRRAFSTSEEFEDFARECSTLRGEYESTISRGRGGGSLNPGASARDAIIGVVLTVLIFSGWWLLLVLLGNVF